MVAGNHHNGQCRLLFVGADDEVIQALLGLERRVDRVEDIAGDQQHIRALGLELAQQPFKETGVFEVAFLAVEVLAQVPVGGMKQTQGELRGEDEKEGSLPVKVRVDSWLTRSTECGPALMADCRSELAREKRQR
ncbi:hypothetical protein PFLmoz3_02473 [Pseudomonas fluorescens]|uniref:Uncharacterized protein n=1 Tax=Pseudomonas fluorescens TaxID=294 RepID=A0A120G7U2_PSEFL|nr:hypothetical protein PFLmoz3_02473 [Pseudomonas fluorescens]